MGEIFSGPKRSRMHLLGRTYSWLQTAVNSSMFSHTYIVALFLSQCKHTTHVHCEAGFLLPWLLHRCARFELPPAYYPVLQERALCL